MTDKNSKTYKILKYTALAGGVVLLTLVLPRSGHVLTKNLFKHYFRKKRFEREKFLRDLKRLQERKLVNYEELPNGQVKIILTKSGKNKVLTYDLDEIKLNKNKNWDGLWRLVMFDIPHYKKKACDAFREKLIELGFYAIQKSVYITPYSCEDEIDFVCSIFNIRKHVLVLYVSKFEGEEKFKYYFKL